RHGAPALRDRSRGAHAPGALRLRRGRDRTGDRMTSLADRKERVRRAYEGLARGDGQGLVELFAPDVVYTVIGTTAYSGDIRSRSAVSERLFRPLVATLATPLAVEVQSLTAEDDRVVAQLQGP